MNDKYGFPFNEKVKQMLSQATWNNGWIVDGDINLSNCELQQLPKFKSVGGSFDCCNNQLTTKE